jgi:sulfide dehydrogenase [flavocytochrome c] flavoprotein subunit
MDKELKSQLRRRLLRLAATGMSAAIIPMVVRADDDEADDDESHDDHDDDKRYREARDTPRTLAQTGLTGKVVVIGGGMAGTTVAKYLRLWGGSGIEVTLVEPNAAYTSNIMSNLVLNNSRSLASLKFGYTPIATKYGVAVKQAAVRAISPGARSVELSDGTTLSYDRLIVAPGVEFMDAYGLTQQDYAERIPHAWQAGPQTDLLKQQLTAMPQNGTFVLTIPKSPYRCPPGPYERACLVADYLKASKGPASKVIILDENASIQAEVENFTKAFNEIHAGIIDYRPGASAISIDAGARTVSYEDQVGRPVTLQADVINPIVPHRAAGSSAGGWIESIGLNNSTDGRWCVVNVLNYESTARAQIHVIGDAASCGMPKAGHVANQEAKICADAIIRALGGQEPDPAPVANSACYSPITATTASWLTAVFQYDASTQKMVVADRGGNTVGAKATEAAVISVKNFSQMNIWFNTLMSDSFA